MRLLIGHNHAVAAWVAERIPQMDGGEEFGPCVGIGVIGKEGTPLGGVVYFNWRPQAKCIEIAAASASRRWLTKSLAREIISYPFDQLGCVRITALTPRAARPARQFLEKFGFRREGLVRYGDRSQDVVLYGLLKREWARLPWGGLDGQEVPERRSAA